MYTPSNKKAIYKWQENHKEYHMEINRKYSKQFYLLNKEAISEKRKEKRRQLKLKRNEESEKEVDLIL